MSNGVMFHHFHGGQFPKVQGSIDKKKFYKIIYHLKKNKKIITPKEFLKLHENKKLKGDEVCLTFDDGIKSQKELILPILDKLKIKAFFFIYTSILEGLPDNLEYFRDFRCLFYKNLFFFYNDFYKNLKDFFPKKEKRLKARYNKNYLIKYKFYTKEDRKFRFCRDKILNKNEYEFIVEEMMKKKRYKKNERKKLLFMNIKDVKKIDKKGHTIGLHSHSHPTTINNLNYKLQYDEYLKSKKILEKVLKKKIWSMSHPCGNYNTNTLKILKKIGIRIGFKADLIAGKIKSNFEVPREDHADLLKRLK